MKISVIGAGAMGGAVVEGLLKTNEYKTADITVADPYAPILDKFAQKGVSVTSDNHVAAEGADIVMVVVKPWLQSMRAVCIMISVMFQPVVAHFWSILRGVNYREYRHCLKNDRFFNF